MKQHGAKGLAWMRMENGKLESSIVKFFSDEHQRQIINVMGAEDGDVLFFSADKPQIVADVLGHLRIEIAKKKGLMDPKDFKFCWITEFPLFDYDEEKQGYTPAHHMFCQPLPEWLDKIESEYHNISSILVIPWIRDDIDEWKKTRRAKEY